MTGYYVDEEHEDDHDVAPPPTDAPAAPLRVPRRPVVAAGNELEGRTTWMYLGLLGLVFVGLIGFSRACAVDPTTPTDLLPTEGDAPVEAGDVAARLSVEVEGDIVRLAGAVPDEGARQQVLDAAAERYGPENVIDELVVDETTTLDGGVLTVTGSVVFGDDRPETLRNAITASLGLSEGEFSVTEGEATVDPVELSAELVDGVIRFSGTVPDDGSAVELAAAAEAVFGPDSADTSGLSVGDVTWTESTVTVTGVATPGDERHEALPAEIQNRFGSLVEVDLSGVAVDTSTEALGEVSQSIVDALDEQSITFAPNSAEIDDVSNDVLATIAELLRTVPGVPVEVVGHTDDLGPDDENFTLSQLRAEAVVDRLVTLGLDRARFTARGEGETNPIVPNDSADNRALNRRIEFTLGG